MLDSARKKPSKLAVFNERFPSLGLWEEWWERSIDLDMLRAKGIPPIQSAELAAARAQEYPDADPARRIIDVEAIRKLVDNLELSDAAAQRLQADAELIAAWHKLPADRAAMLLDGDHDLAVLRTTATAASKLLEVLTANSAVLEPTIEMLLIDSGEADIAIDVLSLSDHILRFVTMAERALSQVPAGHVGRRRDARRNRTLALAIWAVEAATRTPIKKSRGNKRNAGWHFTNLPGYFVRDLMALLRWRDERVLVGAYEKIIRAKPVKQSAKIKT